jgi:hypothetical protein
MSDLKVSILLGFDTVPQKRNLKYTVAKARDLHKRSNYFDAEYASN